MASAQDKQKQYADQHGRKNNERFSGGDKVLLSTATLPNNAISVQPGITTKLLPRFIGPFTVVEEDGDLNYRLTLPPYMKTHPVFYVGRLKRYVDPEEIQYPNRTKVSDCDVDCDDESSDVRLGATGTANNCRTSHVAEDLESEEDSAVDAGCSSQASPTSPSEVSGDHPPDDPSHAHRANQSSVARLDSLSRKPNAPEQHSVSASEPRQGTQPRIVGRNRRSYRALLHLWMRVGTNFSLLEVACPPLDKAEALSPCPVERITEEFRLLGTG